MKALSNKKSFFIIILVGFVSRLIYVFQSYNNNVMAHFADDLIYDKIAMQIYENGIWAYLIDDSMHANIIGPILPFIMVGIKYIFGTDWLPIFIVNVFMQTVLIFIIYKFALKFTNSKTALISAFWSSFYILFIKYSATSGKEIWTIFLFALTVWLIIEIICSYSKILNLIILLSIIFSLLIHLDERYFAYFPVIVFSLVAFRKLETPLIRSLKYSSLFCLIVLLLMLPWLIRNYKVHDEFVLLTTRTTHVTSKLFGKESKISIFKKEKVPKGFLTAGKIDSVLNGYKILNYFGEELSDQQYAAMRDENIIPYKFSFLENSFTCFTSLWKPIDLTNNYTSGGYRFDGKWSLEHNLSVALTYGILLLFSISGWILLYKKNKKVALFLVLIVIYHTVIHMLFIPFTRNRYRLPIDFIIIILGSYGMWYSYSKFCSKMKSFINSQRLTQK